MERIYRKLTDVRHKQLKPQFKPNLSIQKSTANSTKNLLDSNQNSDVKRQASYCSTYTTDISSPPNGFGSYKSPSVAYLPISGLEDTYAFSSFQQPDSNTHVEARSEISLMTTKNWSTSFYNDETRYKVASNNSFKSNLRKNSTGLETRKNMLTRNNYYNDKILKTLLRSNSGLKNKVSPKTDYYASRVHTTQKPEEIREIEDDKKYVTHHNMPIQSKLTKGINTKLRGNISPNVSVLLSERKVSVRSRIIPKTSFAVSNTVYSRQ